MNANKVSEALRNNPVRTSGGLSGALVGLWLGAVNWALNELAFEIPGDVRASVMGVAIVLGAVGSEKIGKYVQAHFTEPKQVLDNLIKRQNDVEQSGTAYSIARANDDTDHSPELD